MSDHHRQNQTLRKKTEGTLLVTVTSHPRTNERRTNDAPPHAQAVVKRKTKHTHDDSRRHGCGGDGDRRGDRRGVRRGVCSGERWCVFLREHIPAKRKTCSSPPSFFFFVFLAARARSPYGANAPRLARGDVWRRGQCGSADTIRLFFPNTHTRMKAGGGVFKTAALQVLRRERKLMSTGDVTR